MRILVAEDDLDLGPSLKQGLEENHYAVDLVRDGEDTLSLGLAVPYDLLILDILLPHLNGFEVCQELRQRKRTFPILMLTALNEIDHRVRGLDSGADDYLTKPFAFREFEARVRALLRRESFSKSLQLRFQDIVLDTTTYEVYRGARAISLKRKEYLLLEVLMRYPNQVLSQTMIAEHIWDIDSKNLSNVIVVYIHSLRSKLCEQGEPDVIETIRGFGYQLKEPNHDQDDTA